MTRPKVNRREFLAVGVASAASATAAMALPREREARQPGGPRVRRNVYHMDWNGPEIAGYREAVRVMKLRPASDPTSWEYQAAIHGSFVSPLALHHTCVHHNYHFFPWHRAYLFYFERMIQQAAGIATLALPYWNYSVVGQARVPEPFRIPAAATNSLWVPTAQRALTGNQTISPAISDYMDDAAAIPYTSTMSGLTAVERGFGGAARPTPEHSSPWQYGGTLELGPHDNIHVAIGGNPWNGPGLNLMSHPDSAALDPIFWLHHANIDRLWNRWQEMGGGRQNPTDAAWLNTSYEFFDETGTRVSKRASDLLSTVDLGYRYDDDPCPPMRIPPRVVVTRPPIPLQTICDRFPALCSTPWPLPGPGPIPPRPFSFANLQGMLLGRTQEGFTLGATPVVLTIAHRGQQLRELAGLSQLRDGAPSLSFELDVVDPRPGEIVRLEVRRAPIGANTDSWVEVGQVAFFMIGSERTAVTATIMIPDRVRGYLAADPGERDEVAWRLRRVTGRLDEGGREVPPGDARVQVREARFVMKTATPPGTQR